jgi:hypothetical protein
MSIVSWSTATMFLLVSAAAEEDASGLCPKEKAEGFVALFDGKTMEGWVGAVNGYTAEDGRLLIKQHGGGNLFTEKEYSDFIFRFEFKLPPGGNNGIGIRSPLKGNPAFAAMEIQVIDNSAPKYAKLKDWQYHGSIYGVVPAKRGCLKPVGEWNSEEIKAEGSRITVTVNEMVIVDADLAEVEPMDGHAHPGLHRETGHIGFLGHGAGVEFRNIRIKPLEK